MPKKRIRAYAQAMSFELGKVFRDAGESAKSLQRPGFGRVVDGMNRGAIGRVVVLTLDRLTRSTRDMAGCSTRSAGPMLHSFPCRNLSIRKEPEVVWSCLCSVWLLSGSAKRTRSARQRRWPTSATSVLPTAQRRFGYRREGSALVAEPLEQEALEEEQRMDAAGASYRAIVAMLQARGAKPKRAKVWHAASVRATLQSKIATAS